MSFIGRHLDACYAVPFSWYDTSLIVVSGDGPNMCGHALIRAGRYYFHIAGLAARPYYMGLEDYKRYLAEAGKTELFSRKVYLPNPDGAQKKLEELSVRLWHWFGIPNNCVTYVEELFLAGGAHESILSNCPVRWR